VRTPRHNLLNWTDRGIALGLVVLTTVLLGWTADMGISRDESFYFRYAETYQVWFTELDAAMEAGDTSSILSREKVNATWTQNFEHPPLMKVLFAWSWQNFATKRRNVSQFRQAEQDDRSVTARISNSSAADGYAVGDTVTLLGPQVLNSEPDDPARILGTGTITKREKNWSTVSFQDTELADIKTRCAPPRPKSANEPHPWIAGCQAETTESTHFLSEIQSLRFPSWILSGLLVGLVFVFGTQLFGRSAGLIAAVSMLFVPRFFFHAHLSAFDVGVITTSLATIYAYWRSLNSTRWAIAAGVFWGLALLTKHNAFFIPIPLVLAWLAADFPTIIRKPTAEVLNNRKRWIARSIWLVPTVITLIVAGIKWGLLIGLVAWLLSLAWTQSRIRFPAMPKAFLLMPPIGFTLYFLLWPCLWYDTAQSFHDYFNFHWEHVHYLQQYFGTVLQVPPFPIELPLMMTVLTVPVPQWLLFLCGITTVFIIRRAQWSSHDRWFLLLNMAFPIVLISMPSTPIFGGVKHWFMTMVFFALFVGVGFDWLLEKITQYVPQKRPLTVAIGLMLATLMMSSSVVDSVRHRNHGTAYYNMLAGGVDGAADWRMHRQFWGYAGQLGLDYVNANAPRNSRVAFHNTTYDAVTFYKRDGLLRNDVHWQRDPSGNCTNRPEIFLYHHQESFAQEDLEGWKKYKSWAPVEVHTSEGVPMLSIYRCSPEASSDKI